MNYMYVYFAILILIFMKLKTICKRSKCN